MLYQKIQIEVATWYITFNSFDIFESLNVFLINTVTVLMTSAKLATPGLLKIKILQNNGYDVIILDCEVTNKISSHHSNYIVNVVV